MANPLLPSNASGPPPVQHGKIKSPVQDNFLATGPGCFEGSTWIVQPDIDTLNQMATDVNVVIFNEHDPISKTFVVFQDGNRANKLLTGFVLRMSLARKNQLNRSLRIVDDFADSVEVIKNQVGAFISGESASESNRQDIGIENTAGPIER